MDITDKDLRIVAECMMKCQLEELEELPGDFFCAFYNEIALNMDIPLAELVASLLKFQLIQESMKKDEFNDWQQKLELLAAIFAETDEVDEDD